MNVAGPSRPRLVPGPRDRDNYEEDLTRMIAQLDLTDVERLQTLYDNRLHRGEGLTDREVAFALLMQNARELAEFNADRVLAQRLADEEPDPAPGTTAQTQTWGQWFTSFFSTTASSGQTTPPANPGQAPTAAPKPALRATGHDCVICQDPIFGAEVRAPCGHFYDIGCITDLFQSATRDESLYPPRCCRQNIPLPQVRPHLTQTVLAEFTLKAQEFGTMKRVYCVAPTCSRFLGPLHEGFLSKVFTCPSPTCNTTTCGKCRGRYEGFTHFCTPDAETEQVLTLSRASGWARCPGCAQMIELNMGCFHMTCRCKTEFCYMCKALWKTCRCPQWDEARLLAAAERRVDAQLPPARHAQPANPLRPVPPVRQPVPAAGVGRNQPIDLPRPAPAPVVNIRPEDPPQRAPVAGWRPRTQPTNPPRPAPAPVVNIRPADPPQRAPPTNPPPAPAPVVNIRPADPPQRAPVAGWRPRTLPIIPPSQAPAPAAPPIIPPSQAPAPAAPPIIPPRQAPAPAAPPIIPPRQAPAPAAPHIVPPTMTHHREAPAPAALPVPPSETRKTRRRAEVNARVSAWFTGVTEPQPASTTVTPGLDRNADVRQRLIRETMERLRVDHDCDHTTWRYRRGNGRCESCDEHLPFYLFRCARCQMHACNRCRRNRL
ncbi:hypothetical protein P692DRAFT_201791821 [Suillus brevipes Sb2]|nr:hypothetical protein P692DRAFT_201791821 [Suillus brevipes Sb2]